MRIHTGILIAALLTAGCGGGKDSTSSLSVSPTTLTFDSADADTKTVQVESNGKWTVAVADGSWCSVDRASGSGNKTLSVSVSANTSALQRNTTVTLNGAGSPASFTVSQPGVKVSPSTASFAKGADIGWVTEMEANGYKFYNSAGAEKELTALLKEIGLNSVRYRVWVNPSAGYNGKADVLAKCRRAQALGMQIMIDFHYSDTWADPSHQIVPAAWQDYTSSSQMANAIAAHTKDVLQTLKNNGINVTWVQVGNEVTVGMLRHKGTESSYSDIGSTVSGKIVSNQVGHFVEYLNAGYDAVKAVYPEAGVILHIDNAWKDNAWYFTLMDNNGAKYDMIGLSLYPSSWDDTAKEYPDWTTKTQQAVSRFGTLHSTFAKPVMLVEFGMPVSQPDKGKAALQYILTQMSGNHDWFKGVFWWEPEAESSRNGYDYGAFSGGKPTAALDPFK